MQPSVSGDLRAGPVVRQQLKHSSAAWSGARGPLTSPCPIQLCDQEAEVMYIEEPSVVYTCDSQHLVVARLQQGS